MEGGRVPPDLWSMDIRTQRHDELQHQRSVVLWRLASGTGLIGRGETMTLTSF